MNSIEKLTNQLSEKCRNKHYSLVTAESCTGGGLSYYMTKNPKCSALLERGYVVYSITSKEDLGVASYTIQTFGAVSEEVAREMAEKALEKSKAHFSIGITGIDESAIEKNKPGIVWIACAGSNKKTQAKKFAIAGDREIFCKRCIRESLKMLVGFID